MRQGTASGLLSVLPLLLSGCALLTGTPPRPLAPAETVATAPDPAAPRMEPLATVHFDSVPADAEIVGDVQVLFTRYENTFVQIARRYDVGYEALREANPDVDEWLPGTDTAVYLPTMSILPDAPRDGIVLNLPAMRLYYFTADAGADGARALTTHPIGIGREGWETPVGSATVTQKARDPTWYPPASVRAEHAALGDPLASVVPPGPDNPLGKFALRLSMPGYLIHGTNKPAGVGMRVSHGCIRLFPEDIEALFPRVPTGTPVAIVDQPVLAGWRGDELYLEVHPPLADTDLLAAAHARIEAALAAHGADAALVDWTRVEQIVADSRGLPFPVLASASAPAGYLASARVIENLVPVATESSAASL